MKINITLTIDPEAKIDPDFIHTCGDAALRLRKVESGEYVLEENRYALVPGKEYPVTKWFQVPIVCDA